MKKKVTKCSYPGCRYKALMGDTCYKHLPTNEKTQGYDYIIGEE